ncbi:MAG: hypothetical protein ABI282_05705 [Candidatus Baltobacteraceae bacterium]
MSIAQKVLPVFALSAIAAVFTLPALAQQPAGAMQSHTATATHAPNPIRVTHCNPTMGSEVGFAPAFYPAGPYYWNDVYGRNFYQPAYANNDPTLAIHYVNTGTKVIKTIEFGLIARGTLVAEVRDVGTFSPGADIKHRFGISQNVFPLGTGLPQCLPLRITFADGTKWRSNHLPALAQSLYRH